MINVFKVQAIVFTGVAGGLKEGQAIGELVLGADVVNFEMDCRGFVLPFEPDYRYQLGELPFLKWRFYAAHPVRLSACRGSQHRRHAAWPCQRDAHLQTDSER